MSPTLAGGFLTTVSPRKSQVTHNFCQTWLQMRASHYLLLVGFHNLLSSSQTSGKHFTFNSLLKDMIKNTDEQPDKEIQRTRSGRVLSTKASAPVEGASPSQCMDVHRTGSFPNPILLGFLWRSYHTGMIDS